jgi:predicted nucleotidyltransferase component of viral defense system
MLTDAYVAQVELLVRILQVVAEEQVFALKGGTAINLFYRDLPRLSVDIDLTYLPIKSRADSLAEIDAALDRIATGIERTISGAQARRAAGRGGGETRVLARLGSAKIKIETSPVTRGVVHEPESLEISEAVQDRYGYAEVQVVSFEDLFGGKLHAALDRQHPRDLFDVKLLYHNEGLTDDLFRVFLVYVASSNLPSHELLDPRVNDLEQSYRQEFQGITRDPVVLDELRDTRRRLIEDIRSRLDTNAVDFLLSLHDGAPDFSSIGLVQAAELPAVRWKLQNIQRLKEENPSKHAAQRNALQEVLHGSIRE